MSATTHKLGWIGLGSMGLAMAKNIQKHSQKQGLSDIHFFNRTKSRGDELEELGGTPCETISDLIRDSDVVFISVRSPRMSCVGTNDLLINQVSNDEALQTVINQIVDSGSIKGKIIADTTTVHPHTSSSISTQVQEAGASFVAMPVFGATPIAEAGQLLVAVAGPDTAIGLISPFLKGVIARSVIHVGTEPSKALLLKTTSNFITAGLMFLISEAHVLAEKSGLPNTVLESLIEQNFGAYAHGVSKRITGGVYCPPVGQAPYSDLELGIKDVGHGLGIAEASGMTLQVGELSMRAMKEAREIGKEKGRSLDSSSVYGAVRVRAGLEFESESVKDKDRERDHE